MACSTTPLRLVPPTAIAPAPPRGPWSPDSWTIDRTAGGAPVFAATVSDLTEDLYADVGPATARRYAAALERFAEWLGVPVEAAPATLLAHGRGPVVHCVRRYKQALVNAGRAPSTVNVALAALRNVVRVARQIGLVDWALDVRALRVVAYRDTRGPGLDAIRRMLAAAAADPDARRAASSVALVRVLVDLGLRTAETAALTAGDLEWDRGGTGDNEPAALWVKGKGHLERQRIALPGETAAAIAAWIAVRGQASGSLFGLRPRGLTRRIAALGVRAGVGPVRPSGCRHASLTLALQATNGDVARARTHSRHAHVQTLMTYRDAALGEALSVACLVAARL